MHASKAFGRLERLDRVISCICTHAYWHLSLTLWQREHDLGAATDVIHNNNSALVSWALPTAINLQRPAEMHLW